MYPHRIRLRDPWQHDAGRLLRRFGYPGRIDAHERVWLTLAGVEAPVRVLLNDAPLGHGKGDFEFEITPLLRSRNELALEAEDEPIHFREVAMEVRATAFLRRAHAQREGGEIVATGDVVGHADGPLDLYLILDRSPSGYATVAATEAGTAFRLSAPLANPADESPRVAKIELVQGAVTWFTVEVSLHADTPRGTCT